MIVAEANNSIRTLEGSNIPMKVALVTGASRGLGAEIARQLSTAGWAVAVNYSKDLVGAETVISQINDAGGQSISARFDVTNREQVKSGLADIAERLGPIDLVVNNATGPQPILPIHLQTWEHYLEQLNFFVAAPLLILHELLSDWRSRKSGRIINIGSEVVNLGSPNFGHYVTAKAAMVGMTRSWATELGPDNITVNLVAPGWIPVERHVDASLLELESYKKLVPLGRMGTPREVAGLVEYLASPAADFITGQTLSVNGGRTLI